MSDVANHTNRKHLVVEPLDQTLVSIDLVVVKLCGAKSSFP